MPRVQARTVAEHRRNLLERLYRAFESLLRERGYDALALADIAREAGMARTAIYHYFPDKEALLVAYTAHEMDEFFSDLRAELSQLDDPLERLAAFVRARVTYVATHHLPADAGLRSVLSADGEQAIYQHAAALADTLTSILDEAASEGKLPRTVADDHDTIRLVLACIHDGHLRDLRGPELEAAVASTQAFVRRAVGATAAG